MAFWKKALSALLGNSKKRHNPEKNALVFAERMSKEEFLKIYENMPERARAQLFVTLSPPQKQKLMALLAGAASAEEGAPSAEPDNEFQAEDFLPEKDERKILRLRHIREAKEIHTLFLSFEEYAPETIAESLAAESPATVAVVLLQLSKRLASQVLKAMPSLKRAEVVRAMASERKIVSEALVSIGKAVAKKLAETKSMYVERSGGIKHINDILKLMDGEEALRITDAVAETDGALAEKLESTRYAFEDLVELNARDFRLLFSRLPDETLWARALKATDQAERKRILGKLPLKRAGSIASAMVEIRTTRLDSIDSARTRILKEALSLASAKKIRFAQNGVR